MSDMPKDIYVIVDDDFYEWAEFEPEGLDYVEYTRTPQWQPIDSAPKDGTDILMYDGEVVAIGWFSTDENQWVWDTDPICECYEVVNDPPTHWQPINPPQGGKDE